LTDNNIVLVLEYDGGRYDGYQRQGDSESSNTIEEKLKQVIERMVSHPVTLSCAARTERGVHAYSQVVNFHTNCPLEDIKIKHYLNRYLPQDIAVIDVYREEERFDAKLRAKSKTYVYRIDNSEVSNVFTRRYTYYSFEKLDVEKMKAVFPCFLGKKDYSSLTSAKRNKSNLRDVTDISISEDGEEILISITADDFLHNMARNMFALIIMAGKGMISASKIEAIMEAKSYDKLRASNIEPAKPQGMYLDHVTF